MNVRSAILPAQTYSTRGKRYCPCFLQAVMRAAQRSVSLVRAASPSDSTIPIRCRNNSVSKVATESGLCNSSMKSAAKRIACFRKLFFCLAERVIQHLDNLEHPCECGATMGASGHCSKSSKIVSTRLSEIMSSLECRLIVTIPRNRVTRKPTCPGPALCGTDLSHVHHQQSLSVIGIFTKSRVPAPRQLQPRLRVPAWRCLLSHDLPNHHDHSFNSSTDNRRERF